MGPRSSISPSLPLRKKERGGGAPYVSLSSREEMGSHSPIPLSLSGEKEERARKRSYISLSWRRKMGPHSPSLFREERRWSHRPPSLSFFNEKGERDGALLIARSLEDRRLAHSPPYFSVSFGKKEEGKAFLISRFLKKRRWTHFPRLSLSQVIREKGKHSLSLGL